MGIQLIFILFTFVFSSEDAEHITVKGKVTNEKDGDFIAAIIEEYGNFSNQVYTDKNGEFEIELPKDHKNILKITYGCSSYYALYEIGKNESYSIIEIYTKKADRNTKKIRKRLLNVERMTKIK